MTEVVNAKRNEQLRTDAGASESFGQRPGDDFVVLRHHKLHKGMHKAFVETSRQGVWLAYEKIGARVVGDFAVVYPEGDAPREYDESYRLARYASLEHWRQTRQPVQLMGDGPLAALGAAAGGARRTFLQGSDGAYYMVGALAPDIPHYFPAVDERYERVDAPPAANDTARPVRYDVPLPGDEVTTLRYWKITRGSFDVFNTASREGVWPLMHKMGARVVGQWRIVHPDLPAQITAAGDYDEVLMMTRYASYQHWQATREPVDLVGNGGDYRAFRAALAARQALSQATWVRFMAGDLHRSPPTYVPTLPERYRLL